MALGFSLLASIIRIFGGWISDKIGGELVSIIAFSTIFIGASVVVIAGNTNFSLSLIGEILMGIGMGIANGAVFKLVPKYIPHATGGAAGWVGGLGAFGGFVVPPILGLFVENYGITGYSKGFITYMILSLSAIAISFALWKAYGKEINKPIEE
jgi:NNP family nitrate/nitrite transporter-like MFS transporter